MFQKIKTLTFLIPQTVFDCRGSNGVVLKGAVEGATVAGELPGSISVRKKQWFVTPTFKNPS